MIYHVKNALAWFRDGTGSHPMQALINKQQSSEDTDNDNDDDESTEDDDSAKEEDEGIEEGDESTEAGGGKSKEIYDGTKENE
ncbi:hypothetical protein OEA41_010873 [Lepraria neglecta]|uniref:Uncharacterized protein n=1 Tax=Lepraria neglecta TaxID=209136 RepID=A0AAD9YX61_9LECA|nr:hypothetical protein OEA41_010873 [Lepraria neglecta]